MNAMLWLSVSCFVNGGALAYLVLFFMSMLWLSACFCFLLLTQGFGYRMAIDLLFAFYTRGFGYRVSCFFFNSALWLPVSFFFL
jgi:hypothetical protein